jgi:hypothetical protein
MRHTCAYKLAATYKMAVMYFLVIIHINNQSTLHEVNGVVEWSRLVTGALNLQLSFKQEWLPILENIMGTQQHQYNEKKISIYIKGPGIFPVFLIFLE